jgi:predicted lipoprotein with Yx(FWY)xxD motif
MRTDGTVQVTVNGWPMYLFVRDTAPGEANGQGSTGFGGLWQVVPAS